MRKKFFSFLILVLMSGFFTPFSQSQAIGETLGYSTSIDIYLDVDNPNYSEGQGFNWSSATRAYDAQWSNCSGARDFVFSCSVAGDKKFMCAATKDVYGTPWTESNLAYIPRDGWYTFKHSFYNDGYGALLVKMDITDKNGTNFGHWELSNPGDLVGINIGGNGHGMFTRNTFDWLAIDDSKRLASGSSYYQGFESHVLGWFDTNPFTGAYYRMLNIPSGTKGIIASEGNFYTEVDESFTNWGGYADPNSCAWPTTPTPVRSAKIISPTLSQVISGDLFLEAGLYNDNSNNGLEWWVKIGECSDTTGAAKIGNVGISTVTPYEWDNKLFTATASTTDWAPGKYCFIFNPGESATETDIRLTQDFSVVDVTKPVVVIANPADNAIVKGVVNIQANASDANLTTCWLTIKTSKDGGLLTELSREYDAATCRAGIVENWNTALTTDGSYSIDFKAIDSSYLLDDTTPLNWNSVTYTVVVDNTTVVTPPEDICLRPYDKEACKKGGWAVMREYGYDFKNQGDCISFLESAYNAHCYKY